MMKRIFLFFMLLTITMCIAISQTYVHIVNQDETSSITQITDLAIYGLFDSSMPTKMADTCKKVSEPDIDCTVTGNRLNLNTTMNKNNGYFTLENDYGFPYITYTLTINALPNDKFHAAMIKASGVSTQAAESQNLSKKEDNKILSSQLKAMNMELNYVVALPGELISATAGSYQANISNGSALFVMSDVFADSEPLVIKSKSLNLGALAMLVGVVFLVVLAYLYLKSKQRKTESEKIGKTKTKRKSE
jgi:hypothetical protein